MACPRLIIARPKQEDIKQLTESLKVSVPMGLRVRSSEIRDKLGLSDPDEGADVLRAPAESAAPLPGDAPAQTPPAQTPPTPALQSQQVAAPAHPAEQVMDAMADQAAPHVELMAASIEAMLGQRTDLGEFRQMLVDAFPKLDTVKLGDLIASGLAAANAAGRSDLEDESA